MDIGNALRRTGKEDITTRSIISKTVQNIYWKHLDIKSIKIHGDKIIVHTGNALINSELSLLSWDIKKASQEKLKSLGIQISANVKFIFT